MELGKGVKVSVGGIGVKVSVLVGSGVKVNVGGIGVGVNVLVQVNVKVAVGVLEGSGVLVKDDMAITVPTSVFIAFCDRGEGKVRRRRGWFS